jgi:hypothetical protein
VDANSEAAENPALAADLLAAQSTDEGTRLLRIRDALSLLARELGAQVARAQTAWQSMQTQYNLVGAAAGAGTEAAKAGAGAGAGAGTAAIGHEASGAVAGGDVASSGGKPVSKTIPRAPASVAALSASDLLDPADNPLDPGCIVKHDGGSGGNGSSTDDSSGKSGSASASASASASGSEGGDGESTLAWLQSVRHRLADQRERVQRQADLGTRDVVCVMCVCQFFMIESIR